MDPASGPGIRERRIATQDEALTDIALPAVREALAEAGADPAEIDLVICATVTPDMLFPTTSALMADALGMRERRRLRPPRGLHGLHVRDRPGLRDAGLGPVEEGARRRRRPALEDPRLGRPLDARAVRRRRGRGRDGTASTPGGFLGFELGADGGGGVHLCYPGSGSRHFDDPKSILKMNGREVFKFATRVMVSSAEAVLEQCGKTIADVDVYVPHQANKRIIDYAVGKLGIPPERTVVNVDRFGNTSSGSIPLALADARAEGRLADGALVLMTGNGCRAHLGLGADRMERLRRSEE